MDPLDSFHRPGNYILVDGKPVPEPDLLRWADWHETADRSVEQTWADHEIWVSTVFLGLDHNHIGQGPPVLWETGIFIRGGMETCRRYSSLAAAKRGHWEVVVEYRKKLAGLKGRGARFYILDEAGFPVPCEDTDLWSLWMHERQAQRDVAMTQVGRAVVITQFTGYHDVGPLLLWTTFVQKLGEWSDLGQYASAEEARAGHDTVVKQLREQAVRSN